MMGLALARYRWSADQFWQSTPHEFFAAFETFKAMNKRSS